MLRPKVSILCPSFNHERYISFFLDSVLSQTEKDFELIVVDDCSSDGNLSVLRSAQDSRVVVIEHHYNKGINAALNAAYEASRGDYIAFVASDDLLEPTYVQNVVRCFDSQSHIDVFYTSLLPIDDSGDVIESRKEDFVRHNRSKYSILREIFYVGNQLLSPGMAMRRGVFRSLYPLDLSLVQYQDCKMHIDILLFFTPFFSTERLVRYRVPSSLRGISNSSLATQIREDFETNKLMDAYLAIKDVSLLEAIFGDAVATLGKATNDAIPFFLARLALQSRCIARRRWGYQILMECIQTKDGFDALYLSHHFSFKDFLSSIGIESPPDEVLRVSKYKRKIQKYKKLSFFSFVALLVSMIVNLMLLHKDKLF